MEALILTHGGYTPSFANDLCCFGGSGYIRIPTGITLVFNSKPKRVSVGLSSVEKLLQGVLTGTGEIVKSGENIRNYSLTPSDTLSRINPNSRYDTITITNGKAHMSDIFEAIRHFKLPYTRIYSFACRVNRNKELTVGSPTDVRRI
ncbi:hypothetical protein XBI1_600009 [Xenorhabdus bovienii str. Intermedium]|uniref:Putative adhesin Stv domain-containing protein n=2 Tax=Xenorhabdus bovienii TaxID=40576 RepID=A0A077QFN2_XENBV|nr:hypothetical protein XBI1_600009 [Xenorhabdus bovienii str. Intermedium]